MFLRCQMAQDKPSLGETAWWPLPLSPILSHTLKTHGNRDGGGRGYQWCPSKHTHSYTQALQWLTPEMQRYQGMPWHILKQAKNLNSPWKIWLACGTAALPHGQCPTSNISCLHFACHPCPATWRCYLTSACMVHGDPPLDLCRRAATGPVNPVQKLS